MRNKEIDILRGVAILMIVVWHSWLFWTPDTIHIYQRFQKYFNSTTGVELFFVISGFFFAKKFSNFEPLSTNEKLSFIANFYSKKMWRLYPILFIWSIITFFISKHDFGKLVAFQQFVANISFTGNIYSAANPVFTGYFWFLALDMQFMLAMPILRVFLSRKETISVCVALILLNTFLRPENGWLFRYDAILYGYLIYEFINIFNIKVEKKLNSFATILLCFVLLLILNSTLNFLNSYSNLMFSASGFIAAIFLFLAAQSNHLISFSKPLDCFFLLCGKYSFSLYACHIPVFWFVRNVHQKLGVDYSYFGMLISISLLILVTFINYKLIESKDFYKLLKNK